MEKLNIFRCSKILAHYSLIIMCLNIGTPKNYHFPFGINGKVVVLSVSILKHVSVWHLLDVNGSQNMYYRWLIIGTQMENLLCFFRYD